VTGAGISTDSGIPDFRGPQGVWTKNPLAEKLSNIHYYMADPEVRKAAWRARMDHVAWSAQPNPGHLALAALERRGKLHALITQNIDELHQAAGNSPEKVIEVHGTMRKVVCMSCGMTAPMQKALDRVRAGEDDPPCRDCGGIQSAHLVRAVADAEAGRRHRAARECALFLAIGTSLQVHPAACAITPLRPARLVVINASRPYDEESDAVLRAPIGAVPRLVAAALS
jgi:NAD-dependent deacetylase